MTIYMPTQMKVEPDGVLHEKVTCPCGETFSGPKDVFRKRKEEEALGIWLRQHVPCTVGRHKAPDEEVPAEHPRHKAPDEEIEK